MAKKLLGIAALSALSMIPANATIARLQALGMSETDNEGSYYIQDDRNIFLNVANINNYKDTVILEWGANGNNFNGSTLQTDEYYSPKAKGGVIKSHGDFVYGLYLGNESNTSALLRGVATGAYSAANFTAGAMLYGSDNQIDLFFGGENSSVKWAVNGVYTADNDASVKSQDYGYAIRGGLIGEKWDALLNLSVGSKSHRRNTVAVSGGSTANGQEHLYTFDGKLGIQLGGGYQLTKTGKVYGLFKKFDWEQFDSIGATAGITTGASHGTAIGITDANGRGQLGTVDGGFTTYAIGYGNQYENGKGTLFTNIEYRYTQIEVDYTTKAEGKTVKVPLTVGYEHKTNDWLTLRGSVTQNIYGYRENNNYEKLSLSGYQAALSVFGSDTNGVKATITNSTDVRAGATLTFGNLKIDGLLGLGGTNGQISTTAPSTNERGVFDMDRLLARVGMVYSF